MNKANANGIGFSPVAGIKCVDRTTIAQITAFHPGFSPVAGIKCVDRCVIRITAKLTYSCFSPVAGIKCVDRPSVL